MGQLQERIDDSRLLDLLEQYIRRVGSLQHNPVKTRNEIALPATQLKRLAGTYSVNGRMELEVFLEDGKLFVRPPGQGKDRLYASAESKFFSKNAPVELGFGVRKNAKVASEVTVRQGNRTFRATRVEE